MTCSSTILLRVTAAILVQWPLVVIGGQLPVIGSIGRTPSQSIGPYQYANPSETCLDKLKRRQNDRHFTDDIFKCICISTKENIRIFIEISLIFDLKGQINNKPVEMIGWRQAGSKLFSELVMTIFTGAYPCSSVLVNEMRSPYKLLFQCWEHHTHSKGEKKIGSIRVYFVTRKLQLHFHIILWIFRE